MPDSVEQRAPGMTPPAPDADTRAAAKAPPALPPPPPPPPPPSTSPVDRFADACENLVNAVRQRSVLTTNRDEAAAKAADLTRRAATAAEHVATVETTQTMHEEAITTAKTVAHEAIDAL